MAHIRIVDMPCGYGKSLHILRSFDKRQKYIAVVPYLSEVDRFIKDAHKQSGFCLTQPVSGKTHKRDHCEKLILAGKSIACTHALFYRLGTLATRPMEEIAEVQFNGKDAPPFDRFILFKLFPYFRKMILPHPHLHFPAIRHIALV